MLYSFNYLQQESALLLYIYTYIFWDSSLLLYSCTYLQWKSAVQMYSMVQLYCCTVEFSCIWYDPWTWPPPSISHWSGITSFPFPFYSRLLQWLEVTTDSLHHSASKLLMKWRKLPTSFLGDYPNFRTQGWEGSTMDIPGVLMTGCLQILFQSPSFFFLGPG